MGQIILLRLCQKLDINSSSTPQICHRSFLPFPLHPKTLGTILGISKCSTSKVALVVKNLPPNAGDARGAGSVPGWDDRLVEEMATHSSIFAWKIPWTEELAGYSP